MIKQMYGVVMSENLNSLRRLPKIVRFQLMTVLALMWSVVFCVWMGAVSMVGPSMAAHAILLVGIFFTADIFRRSQIRSPRDHRSKFKDPSDGCVRYDDLWGG